MEVVDGMSLEDRAFVIRYTKVNIVDMGKLEQELDTVVEASDMRIRVLCRDKGKMTFGTYLVVGLAF